MSSMVSVGKPASFTLIANNSIGIMISEEDLALGPRTRPDHSELLCGRRFITVKKGRESFWHRHQEGDGECPPLMVLSRPFIYFYQTCSHNIHLKLTRLELTIERSHQIFHNIHLNMARLVRRFLFRRRNMSSSETHGCHIIFSTELIRKNIPLSKMSCFVV